MLRGAVLFGSDCFSAVVLEALHKKLGSTNLGLICAPITSLGKGRGASTKSIYARTRTVLRDYASEHSIAVNEVPPNIGFSMDGFDIPSDFVPQSDMGVVASFGYKIPDRFIERFPLGILNVHPSLIPKYRGASPIQTAILRGDKVTGVSILEITPSTMIDSGRLIYQVKTVSGIVLNGLLLS
jgi:methionyl-tRNA formyltransferase